MKMMRITAVINGQKYCGKPKAIPEGKTLDDIVDAFRNTSWENMEIELENGCRLVLFKDAIRNAVFLIS